MGKSPTFSVILPTVSRPTLARTLTSIRAQRLIRGDEVLLCPDGFQPLAEELWRQFGLPGRVLHLGGPYHEPGDSLRNLALTQARGDWLLFMDDDDVYTPGAFDVIRQSVAGTEGLHLFRMRYPEGRTLWEKPEVIRGNVSTITIAVPRRGPLGRWGPVKTSGDYGFCESTLAANGGQVAWHEEVIALVRPHDPHYRPWESN